MLIIYTVKPSALNRMHCLLTQNQLHFVIQSKFILAKHLLHQQLLQPRLQLSLKLKPGVYPWHFPGFFVSYRIPLNWSDMWLWWNKCAEDKTGTNPKSARVNGGTFRQFRSSVLLWLLIDTKIAIYVSQQTISFIEILTNVEYWLYPNKSIIFRMDLFI